MKIVKSESQNRFKEYWSLLIGCTDMLQYFNGGFIRRDLLSIIEVQITNPGCPIDGGLHFFVFRF